METMRNALLERGRSDKSVLREEAASRGKHKKTSQEDARCVPSLFVCSALPPVLCDVGTRAW